MNNPQYKPMDPEEHRRKQIALAVSLTTGFMFMVLSIIIGPIAYHQFGLSGLWGIVLTGVVSLAGFVSAFQISRERVTLGSGILVTTILVMALALPVVAHGQGLALGIMILVLIAGISSATLPTKWATRAVIGAFLIGTVITLTDLYFPNFGLPTNPSYSYPIAILSSLVYAAFTLRRFNSYTLQTKIIIAFALITTIPLIALGYFNSRSFTKALQTQSTTHLTTLASLAANTIDEYIGAQLDSVNTDASQLPLVTYLKMPSSSRKNSVEEANALSGLESLIGDNPDFIRSIALLDTNGENTLDTLGENIGQNESNRAYFTQPFQNGLPYASNIIFHGNEGSIYFSAPMQAPSGQIIGVLRVEYSATVIQSIVSSINPDTQGTIVSLIDKSTYLQVGYTGADRNELFKSYKNFTDLEVAALQAEGRLPSGPKENVLNKTEDATITGLDKLPQQPFFNSYSNSLNSETINTGAFLETQPWITLVRQSTAIYLAPIQEQNRTTILISLLLVVLSVAAGFLASRILASPILRLARVAEQIATGDRSARAPITTRDEIGDLSISFNRMADELNQAFNSLEVRVAERTTDLEIARQQSEKRASELQAIGEISKLITGEQKLENLLPLVSRLVSESFGFYHTGIFLIDETKQFAVLQAANSHGGKNMLARGHRLEVGGSGIVGYVSKFGIPRIALDVGLDAVFFNNPDLPSTRSEMALPLKVHDQTIGVLDVQSEKPGAFTENDTNTLSILADQIAIALENARLFTQTEQALSEAQALYRQNSQESWLTFSREEASVGYHQSLKGGRKLATPIETDEIRQSMNRGNVLVFNADGKEKEASIVVPIKLRGQVIGALNIKAPTKDRSWSNDEVNLAEAISERLSLALENARLIQESQRQVIKEQTISEVTGKIGASINLKNVLQTAVEELGRAMPGSEVVLQLQNENKDGK